MKKLLAFMLITFVATAPLSAKDAFGARNEANAKTAFGKQAKKSPFLVSFGTNLSFYPGEEGDRQLGYSFGIVFNFNIYNNLSMTLPVLYTRINTALKNVEGKTQLHFEEIVYKTLSDWQISAAFFEVPLLFTYKFLTMNSYDINYVLGPGLAFAVNDYSKLKFTRTDEILGVSEYNPSIDPETHELRSTLNIITGVRFHINRFYLDLLYTFYRNNIKGIYKLYNTSKYPHHGVKSIDNLNSVSLKLSIDVF